MRGSGYNRYPELFRFPNSIGRFDTLFTGLYFAGQLGRNTISVNFISLLSVRKMRSEWGTVKLETNAEFRANPWYLLFWPFFGLRYLLIEHFHPTGGYHVVWCALDDRIPFLEWFVVPYVLWYIFLIGSHLWLYRRNDPAYRQYSIYLMVSMAISSAIFLLYPTCQNLRPAVFPRENWMTELVVALYQMDTNTNVCPSEHVIGSAGFFFAVSHSNGAGRKCRMAVGIAALLTAIATVFLKQHSVVDVAAALPVCAVAYAAAFCPAGEEKRA